MADVDVELFRVVVGRSRIAIMPTLSAAGGGRVLGSLQADAELGRRVGSGWVARSAASYVSGVEEVEEGCVYLSLLR